MKNEYLRYIKMFCFIILVITIILIIFDLCDITQYVNLSNNYDWLAYIGTILGGVSAMLGIYFTFSQSQEIEKNSVKPWIKVSKSDSSYADLTNFFFHKKCNKNDSGHRFIIKIENCGSRELRDLRMYESKDDGFYQYAEHDGFISPGLNPNENVMIEVYYFYPKNYNNCHIVHNELFLFFDDCYGNHYYQTFLITYDLERDEKKGILMFNSITAKASSSPIILDSRAKSKLKLAEEMPEDFDPTCGSV